MTNNKVGIDSHEATPAYLETSGVSPDAGNASDATKLAAVDNSLEKSKPATTGASTLATESTTGSAAATEASKPSLLQSTLESVKQTLGSASPSGLTSDNKTTDATDRSAYQTSATDSASPSALTSGYKTTDATDRSAYPTSATGSTTVYTSETPAVVESSDHHLFAQSIPVTHST